MHFKVYITRVSGYYQIGNGLLVIYLFLSDLATRGVISSLFWYSVILLPAVLLCIVTFGFLDVKYGFFRTEQKKIYENVPQLNEALVRLDRIERKIETFK